MKIFNEKPLSQIRQEKIEEITPSTLEVYEIVAAMGEEIEALQAKVEALKGGV